MSTEVATAVVDANGNTLAIEDRVYLSLDLTDWRYDEESRKYVEGRVFDFGVVDSLNDDGTVGVWWDSAGCSCDAENARAEKASELVRMTEKEAEVLVPVAHASFSKGYNEGKATVQNSLRRLVGLSEDDN